MYFVYLFYRYIKFMKEKKKKTTCLKCWLPPLHIYVCMCVITRPWSNDHIGEKLTINKYHWLCLHYPNLNIYGLLLILSTHYLED